MLKTGSDVMYVCIYSNTNTTVFEHALHVVRKVLLVDSVLYGYFLVSITATIE